ncbi:hypothetical protein PACTADRAFT_77118 [Pachysolen tannophilus NRRL Y-2460]|uniref:Oxidoreductase-like domain-containing protein n=1 Tax=Pachysolen tannophilus NRRL Y-2460 TaxID=669874 RepID=A0A1E4TPH4_PACTA|nr:hypothetical protein PACTADRAFT_77118 [Pachysolen tannophilus NRRL Y-2460]
MNGVIRGIRVVKGLKKFKRNENFKCFNGVGEVGGISLRYFSLSLIKKFPKSLTFDTATKTDFKVNFDDIFGGDPERKPKKTSRMDTSNRDITKVIGGVSVPKKPIEPDNCCGSGCVNCVWLLYNDDFQEWKQLTRKACENLMKQKKEPFEKWPLNFDPPPKYLDLKFIPNEYKTNDNNHLKIEDTETNAAEIRDIPVAISVFTDLEKRIKNRKNEEFISKLNQNTKNGSTQSLSNHL